MKKIVQISRISLALVMSIFLFSCEKSEMDSLIPTAQAETVAKKGTNNGKGNSNVNAEPKPTTTEPNNSATADTAYIITFHDANNTLTTQAQIENLATSIGGSITFDQVYWEYTKGFAAALTVAQANAFRADSRVEYVEIDGPIYP